MKKKELLALVNALSTSRRADRIFKELRDYRRYYHHKKYELPKNFGEKYLDDSWHPDIPELQSEFDILSAEARRIIEATKVANEMLNNCKCNHEVRTTHSGLWSTHECVFCGKHITGNNCASWSESEYRNSYCVNFMSYYQEEWDGPCTTGYTDQEIYQMINDILQTKEDDEEVDLVEEFYKYSQEHSDVHVEVNRTKPFPETFVLVIGGTNKEYIDKESCITKDRDRISDIAQKIALYFNDQLDTKVLYVDNEQMVHGLTYKHGSRHLATESYNTLNHLNFILQKYNKPFKLIIDASALYEYSVKKGKVVKKEYSLDLSRFEGAKIIKVKDNLSKDGIKPDDVAKKPIDENTYYYDGDRFEVHSEKYVTQYSEEKGFTRFRKQLKSEQN